MKNLTLLVLLVGVGFFVSAGTVQAQTNINFYTTTGQDLKIGNWSDMGATTMVGCVTQGTHNTASWQVPTTSGGTGTLVDGQDAISQLMFAGGLSYLNSNAGTYTVWLEPYTGSVNCSQAIASSTASGTFNWNSGFGNGNFTVSIYDLVPQSGTVASSTLPVGFTYTAASSSEVSSYSIVIRQFNSTNAPVILTGNAYVGTNTVIATTSLPDGLFSLHVIITGTVVDGIVSGNWESPYDTTFSVTTTGKSYSDTFFSIPGLAQATSSADLYGVGNFLSSFLHKVPIGYMTEIITAVTADLNVPANQNAPLLDMDLHSLGIGSTSPMGNILPDIKISTTTMGTYCPSTCHNTFIGLQDMAMWIGFMTYLWRRGKSIVHIV